MIIIIMINFHLQIIHDHHYNVCIHDHHYIVYYLMIIYIHDHHYIVDIVYIHDHCLLLLFMIIICRYVLVTLLS